MQIPRATRPFFAAMSMIAVIAGHNARAHWEDGDAAAATPSTVAASSAIQVQYKTIRVDNLDIFYREAGPKDAPTILLLHGFPTSSAMFRNLIPALSDKFHVIAPDYPGYGRSSQPLVSEFDYTFDNLARVIDSFTQKVGLTKFTIYVQDYGAPVGFRIASAHPERISGLIVQNGNAYVEGLPDGFWGTFKEYWKTQTPALRTKLESLLTIDATKWQYLHGARDPQNIDPNAWMLDQEGLDRPGNKDIQIALFQSYGSNPPCYPAWQEYFRSYQPPTLIVWGKNDQIFPPVGAEPYKRDLKNIDFTLLDTGHFALEEEGDQIAKKIRSFMEERVISSRTALIPAPKDGFGKYVYSRQPGYNEMAMHQAFKGAVPVKTVVVYCFDPRCDKVPEVLAKAMPGEVYPGEVVTDSNNCKVGSTRTIMPIAVAGGRVVDALRSISVTQHLFGMENIVVVHHTNCGTTSFTNEGIQMAFQKEQGADISAAYNPRDLAIADFKVSLREDVKLLRQSPGVPKGVNIFGYVYNTDTDQLMLVVEDRASTMGVGR